MALAGLDIVPWEKVTFPPPTAIGIQIISSSNIPRSSIAIAIPIISIRVSILDAS